MNQKKTVIVLCLLAGSWTLAALAASPDTIEFKWTHKPGKVSVMKMVTKVVGSMKMPDPMPEQKFNETVEQQVRTTCLKVNPDGSGVYEMEMPSIAMKMDIGGMKCDIRTDAPATQGASSIPGMENMQKLYAALAKGKYTVVIGPDGRTRKVDGFARTMREAIKSLGDTLGPQKAVLEAMSKAFDDDAMREQMDARAGFIPPQGTVRVGDTWNNTRDIKFPMFNMNFKTITDCTLLGVEEFQGRRCAKVALKASMKSSGKPDVPAPATGSPNPLTNMEFNFTGSDGNGIAYWDYENGELVQFRQTMRMVCEITMKVPPATQGQEPAKPFKMVQNLLTSTSMDLLSSKP
jgi:hypothetical protein